MTGPTPESELRFADIADELIERLRPICSAMPHAAFMAMIREMAAIQLKYEQRMHAAGAWGKVPERI